MGPLTQLGKRFGSVSEFPLDERQTADEASNRRRLCRTVGNQRQRLRFCRYRLQQRQDCGNSREPRALPAGDPKSLADRGRAEYRKRTAFRSLDWPCRLSTVRAPAFLCTCPHRLQSWRYSNNYRRLPPSSEWSAAYPWLSA